MPLRGGGWRTCRLGCKKLPTAIKLQRNCSRKGMVRLKKDFFAVSLTRKGYNWHQTPIFSGNFSALIVYKEKVVTNNIYTNSRPILPKICLFFFSFFYLHILHCLTFKYSKMWMDHTPNAPPPSRLCLIQIINADFAV